MYDFYNANDKPPPISTDLRYMDPEKAPYRFREMNDAAKMYLKENGYVVIANVLNENEISHAKQLAWNFLESVGMKQNDPQTWDRNFPGYIDSGIVHTFGAGHSDFQWHVLLEFPFIYLFFFFFCDCLLCPWNCEFAIYQLCVRLLFFLRYKRYIRERPKVITSFANAWNAETEQLLTRLHFFPFI